MLCYRAFRVIIACLVMLCMSLCFGNCSFAVEAHDDESSAQLRSPNGADIKYGTSDVSQAETDGADLQGAPSLDEYDMTIQDDVQHGWGADSSGVIRWYEHGQYVRNHAFYDPASNRWYWADDDGSIAKNKDVFIPVDEGNRAKGGKWVRVDVNGHMITGEDYRYGAWYYFDPITSAMARGMHFISSNGGKWVYYDWVTGQMAHGEKYVNYDASHTGWYLFDQYTGAMQYGFQPIYSLQKWVYYDVQTGLMQYGEWAINGSWYLFDKHTGAVSYGWQYLPNKWVYYSWPSGKMVHGSWNISGSRYQFDRYSGALLHAVPPLGSLPGQYRTGSRLGSSIRSGEIKTIRVLGDSIAAGYGASGGDYPFTSTSLFSDGSVTYFEPSHDRPTTINYLRNYMAQRGGQLINASVPQYGNYQLYNRLGVDTLGSEDAAIVMLGTNDRLENSDEFASNAEQYLSRVNSRYKQMYVVANVPALTGDQTISMQQERDILQRLCRRHGWTFVDLHGAFNSMSTRMSGLPPLEGLYTDGVHPNRMGQDVMWSAFRQAFDI